MAKIWTNPGEVKGLGPRQCNCDDVMKKKIANAPSYPCTISIHYTERAGISPPRIEQSARLLSHGDENGWQGNHMFFTQNDRDSTAFTSRRYDHIKHLLNNKKMEQFNEEGIQELPERQRLLSVQCRLYSLFAITRHSLRSPPHKRGTTTRVKQFSHSRFCVEILTTRALLHACMYVCVFVIVANPKGRPQ